MRVVGVFSTALAESFVEATSWTNLLKKTTTWADSFGQAAGKTNPFGKATVQAVSGVSNSQQSPCR